MKEFFKIIGSLMMMFIIMVVVMTAILFWKVIEFLVWLCEKIFKRISVLLLQ